ncbi:MAG: hypothetical protein IJU96_10910 [Clostridia bacterium]|nr:hypothetical protein [Clostridia bacterium]
MNRMLRNILCFLLSGLLIISVVPLSAVAEELKEITSQKQQTSTSAPSPAEEYEGQLLSAVIVKGDIEQRYELDENGALKLVSEKEVKKVSPRRAPKKESTGMESASADSIAAAAQWALTHSMNEAVLLIDRNGVGSAVYGVGGYDAAVTDADHNGVCDLCGYCLDGCTDGNMLSFTESDIAQGPDLNGKYYNADGVWIGTDAKGTYTYQLEDENGQPLYDEHGNVKTTTMEYTFIAFETYRTGMDGVCDVCGKTICHTDATTFGHSYADGLCDACGACMDEHVNADAAPDGFCDVCGKCTTDCEDGNSDSLCDVCGKCMANCKDENNDGACDTCGACMSGHMDETSASDDGLCDNCGYCMADCKDENADETCDVCGKPMLSGCDHSDLIGKDVCTVCRSAPCHVTQVRLQQLQAQLTQMQALLLDADQNGEASYHDWLQNTLTPFLTAKEDGGAETSLASAVSKRNEARTIRQSNSTLTVFKAYLDELTVDQVTPQSLVGTLERNGDTVTLNEERSLYAQLEALREQHQASLDSVVYEENKAYYPDFDHEFYPACVARLNELAGELFDTQLAGVFGSKTPKKLTVTEENARSLKNAATAVSEALLYKLYGSNYQNSDYKAKADAVWAGGSAAGYDDQTRRSVGFAMLSHVLYAVNALKEGAFASFTQTQYDVDGVYATRPAFENDLLRGLNAPYTVTDETINTLVSRVDGYLSSEEAVRMIRRFLPESLGVEIKDMDSDGSLTMNDLVMSFVTQKLFSDDMINELFTLIFPTVTDVIADVPFMLTENDYIVYRGGGRYTIDLIRAIAIATGGSKSVADAISEAASAIGFGGSFDFYVDGGRSNTLKSVLTGAGFKFWPYQVASLLSSLNNSKYDGIIAALNNSGDNWSNLTDANGKLHFQWGLESFEDFKDVLSVLLSSVSPMLETMFTNGGSVTMEMQRAVYFSLLITLGSIAIPGASDGGVRLSLDSFSYYQDVIVPIFEALGVNSFAPVDGSYAPTYSFRPVNFDPYSPTTYNVGKLVDGLVDPLTVLAEQFTTHPLEKLLSILPNISLMLENGALMDLFDLDSGISAVILAHFNMSIDSFFTGLWDIISNQIMDDWYDWLNPVKYAQLIATVATYTMMQPVLALIFDSIGDIDAADLIRDGLVDVSGEIDDIVSDDVFPLLPDILNRVAAMLGGKLKDGATDFDWPKDVEISSSALVGNLNLSMLLDAYLTSPEAVQALGFDVNKISTVITWFLNNLVDENGNAIHFLDPALLDFDELASLGTLETRCGSIRDAKYTLRWNSLQQGEYYFVKADIADVFYYGLNLITGILHDKAALKTLLNMIGMDYDELKTALASLAANGAETLSLTLSELLIDACDDNGNLDLDKLLTDITTDDLLLVLCETVVPTNDYTTDEISYPESPATTASEIEENGGVIPYLEYDNLWTRKFANLVVNDIDDFADNLLKELSIDLDPSTESIETLREYAKPLLMQYLNEPAYLTLIAQILAGTYDDSLALPADVVKDATGIDITCWANDYAYLFNGGAAPTARKFPQLTGTRIGEDADGNPVVKWTYKGHTVETYRDILAALGYLLTPAQPILDMIFCGKDFKVLTYSKNGQAADSLVTVKGHDGYNFAILPMLEAMGINESKLLTSEQFSEIGAAEGLLYCMDLIVSRLFEIFDSDTMMADLSEMLVQVSYVLSGNGTNAMLKNMMHPLLVLFDTLRPMINIDLDATINTLLCRMTYQIGGYSSAREMKNVLKARNALISLRTLDTVSLLKAAGVICSVEADGTRLFLDIVPIFTYVIGDLAYLRTPYTSKAYSLDQNGQRTARQAYRLDLDGADALTAMASMGIELLMYGSNADVLDAIVGNLLNMPGVVSTAVELMGGLKTEYTTDFDWAYILGKDATAQEKTELLAAIKNSGAIDADDHRTAQAQQDFETYLASYDLTNWDEETAVYLVERLEDMISTLLNTNTGDELISSLLDTDTGDKLVGTLLLEEFGVESNAESYTSGSFLMALVNGLATDEVIDKLLGFLGDFLNGRDNELLQTIANLNKKGDPAETLAMLRGASEKLAQYREPLLKLADAIGVDLAAYDIDGSRTAVLNNTVTYYNAKGEPTGLTRPVLKENLANMENVLYAILTPVMPMVSFLMLGEDLRFFNASGVTDNRERRDDLIRVSGMESYRYVLLPLLEAFGCQNLKSADSYVNNGVYDAEGFLFDVLSSVMSRVRGLLNDDGGNALNGLIDMLPDLFYYVNSNALGVSLQNLTAQFTTILNFYNERAGKSDDEALSLEGLLKTLTGLDIDLTKVSLTDLFSVLAVKAESADGSDAVLYELNLDPFIERLMNQFTVGKIYYNANSVCDFDTYRMTYRDSKDKAATVTILMSMLLDILESPDNAGFLTTLIGDEAYQTICNVYNLDGLEFEYQEPTWLFTDDANQLNIVTAMECSKVFSEDPYAGKLWTRKMAAHLADNLESFVEDTLYLLGMEINGVEIRSTRTLMHALIGGTLFTNDTLNKIAALLGKIKPLLDQYDPDGAIAGFVKELLNVDLHAWDDYAPGGKYEHGRDWGFKYGRVDEAAVDANAAIFEEKLIELLSPAAPILAWLLADSDFTVFVEGDGLGENADPIQITVPGAEGYRYALIPLFEALNIDGSPENLVQNLRDGDTCDPETYTQNVKEDVNYAVVGVVHPLVMMLRKLMDSTAPQLLELMPSITYFINCNGLDTVVKNLTHAVQVLANALQPMQNQIDLFVYNEQGVDLYKTLNVEKIVRENLYELLGVTEADVKEIYEQCGGTWPVIDGLEDVDFRLLFSFALAAVNNYMAEQGLPFKFTSIAGLAVNELTHGYVRSYESLTGNIAYTMVLDKEIDSYCYGDLLSILMRIALKFLAVDGNVDALLGLMRKKMNLHESTYRATRKFLLGVTCYMQSPFGFGSAMLSIYCTVFGASTASGTAVFVYDGRNAVIQWIVNLLLKTRIAAFRNFLLKLLALADQHTGDVITGEGIAPHGYVPFFKQLRSWFQLFIQLIRSLFYP